MVLLQQFVFFPLRPHAESPESMPLFPTVDTTDKLVKHNSLSLNNVILKFHDVGKAIHKAADS